MTQEPANDCIQPTLVRPLDVPFAKRAVTAYSSGGTPYTRWVTFGMPQLGKYRYLLDSVFFLYPDRASAEAGVDAGGTGFFVSIPSVRPDKANFVYAVTNWHVAPQGAPVVRVNTKSGPPDIFEFECHEWKWLANSHDIAAIPIKLDGKVHKAAALMIDSFALQDAEIEKSEIDVGEDVFMLGRFMDYDGTEANVSSARFGHISMMECHVAQPNGYKGISRAVDMHARTGYSGSPVFAYRTAGSAFLEEGMFSMGHMLKLLGILWGSFPEEWKLIDTPKTPQKTGSAPPLTLDGKSVKGWSGMSLLCPAAAILDTLNHPDLKAAREAANALLEQVYPGAAEPMALSVGVPGAGSTEKL